MLADMSRFGRSSGQSDGLIERYPRFIGASELHQEGAMMKMRKIDIGQLEAAAAA
jgi:hypothetical protein